jgi:hypothetical protein
MIPVEAQSFSMSFHSESFHSTRFQLGLKVFLSLSILSLFILCLSILSLFILCDSSFVEKPLYTWFNSEWFHAPTHPPTTLLHWKCLIRHLWWPMHINDVMKENMNDMNDMMWHEWHDLTWITWFDIDNMIWHDCHDLTWITWFDTIWIIHKMTIMTAEGTVGAPTCCLWKKPRFNGFYHFASQITRKVIHVLL